MGTLQLNRGILADMPELAEGESYFVTDKEAMVSKINGVNRVFEDAKKLPDVHEYSFEVPAIDASTRHVVSVPLGQLLNNNAIMVTFMDISGGDLSYTKYSGVGTTRLVGGYGGVVGNGIIIRNINSSAFEYLLVHEDYLKSLKSRYSDNEKINEAGGTISQGFSYEDIGDGVLVGWYGATSTGVLQLDKKIQLEGAWLETSTGITTLKLAFYNADVAANTAKTFKAVVFD